MRFVGQRRRLRFQSAYVAKRKHDAALRRNCRGRFADRPPRATGNGSAAATECVQLGCPRQRRGLTLYALVVVELWHEQVVERPRAAVGA